MKIPKTLRFMFLNPIPLIVHLTWWFLFATLGVVLDDPFVEGTWPHIVQIVKPPSSIGNFATAASIIFEEIVKEFTRDGAFLFFIATPAFIISYREARGNLQGIARNQQTWMRWYYQQQETIAQESTFEESLPSSEDRKVNSYFGKALRTLLFMVRNPVPLIVHFACWFFAFVLLYAMTYRPGIVAAASNFARMLPEFFIIPAILALLSSYQETRGTVKGIAKVRRAWTEWHHRQQEAKTQETRFDVPPPLFDTAG